MKDQLAKQKKKGKEIKEWESGKFALKCITAEIDSSVVGSGSIGGLLDYSESSSCITIIVCSLFLCSSATEVFSFFERNRLSSF